MSGYYLELHCEGTSHFSASRLVDCDRFGLGLCSVEDNDGWHVGTLMQNVTGGRVYRNDADKSYIPVCMAPISSYSGNHIADRCTLLFRDTCDYIIPALLVGTI